jgi:hypothetical protein
MPAESYWCTTAPNVPRIYSASSLQLLSECPRKFQYQYVEGWTTAGENLDFIFGTKLHRCLEWYWRRILQWGYSLDEALLETTGVAMALGLELPQPTRPNQVGKTRMGLVNALIWYIDYWSRQDDPLEICEFNSEPAIEMYFRIILPTVNPDGKPYMVQGYVDQMRNWSYGVTAWDYKSTSKQPSEYYLNQFDLSLQCAIYTIGMQVLTNESITTFMADVIGVDTRVRGLPYEMPVAFMERKPVTLTPEELDEHLMDIQVLIKNQERYAEQNYWPKNTKACRFCDFRDICKKSPQLREPFLKTEFNKERRTELSPRRE